MAFSSCLVLSGLCSGNSSGSHVGFSVFARYFFSVPNRCRMQQLETFTEPSCRWVCLLVIRMLVVDRRISGTSASVHCCSPPRTEFHPPLTLQLTAPWALRLVRSTAQSFAAPFVDFLFLKELFEIELKSLYQRKEILPSDFWAYNQPV